MSSLRCALSARGLFEGNWGLSSILRQCRHCVQCVALVRKPARAGSNHDLVCQLGRIGVRARSPCIRDSAPLPVLGQVNRYEKSGKDASEWVPDRNRCWFAGKIVEVRLAYGLTIDRREADALERILSGCESMALEPVVCSVPSSPGAGAASAPAGGDDALALYDDNGNGMITCAEARQHGIAPVPRSHPAYRYMRDADADGVVCE